MTDILDLEIRKKIYALVITNPGLHARKIAEILTISGQLADYHLTYLERHKVLTTTKDAGYRRYYVEGKLGLQDRMRISTIRREMPLRIILFLLDNPSARHKDILEQLNIVKSTLSFHLDRLIKSGIICATELNGEKRYYIANEDELLALLMQYKPYSRIEGLKDTWVDLNWPRAKEKKRDDEKKES
jgi:predicted transcriptional regulator